MGTHAHPLEVVRALIVLLALIGSARSVLMRIDARDFARVDLLLKSEGALTRLRLATANIWAELFRLTVIALDTSVAVVALYSQPEELADFVAFPQTLFALVTGIVRAGILLLWVVFDVHVRPRNSDQRTRIGDPENENGNVH